VTKKLSGVFYCVFRAPLQSWVKVTIDDCAEQKKRVESEAQHVFSCNEQEYKEYRKQKITSARRKQLEEGETYPNAIGNRCTN
jgi:hypothetical protein